jgi:type I restriction enzyme M protein
MVRIVNPQLGERVYDPAAGSAGFLAESFEHMRQGERTLADYASLREATFFGQESGELPFLLGSMNLILHGITLPDIVRHNTLEQDVRGIPADQQYDVILTNPPFGGKENPQIQQNFPIKSAATEILFLQHVMSFLSVNGRAAIVLPDGILFREERSFYRARVRLVEDFNLTAIIRLPPGVFPYATATRTNLVMFDRGSATKSVRFYRVSAPTESGFGKTRPIGSDDLQGAFEWVCNGEANPNSWEVSLDEIRKGRYDLDLLPPEEANELEPEALAVRVATFATEARAATELLEPLRRVETSSDAFAFDRIALLGEYVLERGARAKSVKPTNFIGVTNTGGIAPFKGEAAQNTSRYRLVDVGDFVYNPMRINVGSIGLCRTEAEAGYTSPDYVVFRLRDDAPISAEYVLLYLQSLHGRHQIERNTQGSVRSRLYFANLCKVRIPIPAKPEAWESVGAASRILVLLPRELSAALAPLLDGLLRWSPSLSPSPEPGNIEDEGEEEGEEEGEDEDECEETDDE